MSVPSVPSVPSWAAVALVLITASGCGYSLAGRGSFLPSHIRTIGIPIVENRTSVARVEQMMTDKIRAEFIGRGKYSVVHDATGADAVLRGEIVSFTRQPVGLNDQQLASRYMVTVVMKMTFTDTRSSEVIWSNDALTFREEYDQTVRGAADDASFVDQQGTSFERLATDVARAVVTAITEAF